MPILKGTIKDKITGETLPGATIIINGEGKISDSSGNFIFVLKNNSYNAEIRFLGYKTQVIKVPLYDNTDLIVSLDPDTSLLNEIEVKAKRTYKWVYLILGTFATLYILDKWKK
jgi:hypothetical protein